MKVRKQDKEVSNKIAELLNKKGPRNLGVKSYGQLVDNLQKLKVTPGEAYRIIQEKLSSDNTRFNWKMMRLTMYVWERLKEEDSGYLKPKIDTIRRVVEDGRFKDFFYGYYPDLEFEPNREIKLLNKLITEKQGYQFLVEGYYLYPRTNKHIPQKHLDSILWPKKSK